jgi:predicted transposase YdaD
MRTRHSDTVWRVRFRGKWLYLYLLPEFQSSDDYFMGVRLMVYVGLLYQDIIRTQNLKRGDTLPPVVPMVIYNGRGAWQAPLDVRELIHPVQDSLKPFIPSFRYWLLDENRISKAELGGVDLNLVRELIAFEMCTTPEEIRARIADLIQKLESDEYRNIQRIFAIWLSRLLRTRFKKDAVPEYHALTEVEAMLAEKMTEWTEEWEKKGHLKGKMEGRMEERMETIKKLRTEKFQTLMRLYNFNISPDKIAAAVNLPLEKVNQIIALGERGMDLIQAQDLGLTDIIEEQIKTETP